jgi:hypothetical protein
MRPLAVSLAVLAFFAVPAGAVTVTVGRHDLPDGPADLDHGEP